jgi:hypothetical protein
MPSAEPDAVSHHVALRQARIDREIDHRAVAALGRGRSGQGDDAADSRRRLGIVGLGVLARRQRTRQRAHHVGQQNRAVRRRQRRHSGIAEIIGDDDRLPLAGDDEVGAAAGKIAGKQQMGVGNGDRVALDPNHLRLGRAQEALESAHSAPPVPPTVRAGPGISARAQTSSRS